MIKHIIWSCDVAGGFMGDLNRASMMPSHASLSGSCAPDRFFFVVVFPVFGNYAPYKELQWRW